MQRVMNLHLLFLTTALMMSRLCVDGVAKHAGVFVPQCNSLMRCSAVFVWQCGVSIVISSTTLTNCILSGSYSLLTWITMKIIAGLRVVLEVILMPIMLSFNAANELCTSYMHQYVLDIAKLVFSIWVWKEYFQLVGGTHGFLILATCIIGAVLYMAYGVYQFLCAANNWIRAWYKCRYPAHSRNGDKLVYINGACYAVVPSSSQIPMPKVHNAKSRHAIR